MTDVCLVLPSSTTSDMCEEWAEKLCALTTVSSRDPVTAGQHVLFVFGTDRLLLVYNMLRAGVRYDCSIPVAYMRCHATLDLD